MKKSIVISIAILLGVALYAAPSQFQNPGKDTKSKGKALRKMENTKVSDLAKTHFYADFGDIPGTQWERTTYFDEAAFTQNGQKMRAFYDYDATLVGTCVPKTLNDLPVAAQKEIKNKYKDYAIKGVILFDDNEKNESDMYLYNTQFDSRDNYFVELQKEGSIIVLQVSTDGIVYFFKKL